ncbi:hypothetical protein PAL_GLEAN10024887 [Pteropus alecto]|uniref:Uncharacterized protein n=1 Tax=Pteropus alecto TaxID=9402 RepID=L5KJE1_PTEAL|nr:hypothetical protein PAL_GLEAN10024887 [Pteropus alecto]
MNDASQATGARRPRTEASYRGRLLQGGKSALLPPASSARKVLVRLRYGWRKLAHPRRAGPGSRGRMPARLGHRASRSPSTANSEPDLYTSGHSLTTGPQAPACFDRDVTSYFFFRFLDQKCFALLQRRGLPGSFPLLRCAVLTARELPRQPHFRGLLWASRTRPKSRPPATPPSIAPPPASPPRHPACVSLVSLRR